MTIHPVILSGGSGIRLWPLSGKSFPKQLHNLLGERSLYRESAARIASLAPPLVICNGDHRFIIGKQLREIGVAPCGVVAAIGLDILTVVATGDAILVTAKDMDHLVGSAVETLRTAGRREAVQTLRDWRPWGRFETLIDGPRFHVRKPGQDGKSR